MNKIKTIGKGVLILLAGILIGTALLWLAYLLPVTEESVHVAESTLMLEQEGLYPVVPMMYQTQSIDARAGVNPGGILDNFTDSIMISTAGHEPTEGALYQAMNMAGNQMPEGYSRYWHGYVALLRPLLLFFNYADLRVLNQLLQLTLIAALACMLYRQKGFRWAALALTVYGLLLPISLSQSLQYSWVFYIGMAGSLAVVRFHDWLTKKQRLYLLFLLLGMLTCYMDLLTYPLFTWGIPMVWWIVTEDSDKSAKRQLLSVVLCGVAWICGYGGLWAGKWLIGGIVLHRPVWIQAWNQVQYRAGTIPDTDGSTTSHWKVLANNLGVFQSIQGISLLGSWSLWWGCQIVRKRRGQATGKTLAMLLIALSPIVWYVVLHNHTFIHYFFTYRIWVVALTALLAAMIDSLDKTPQQAKAKGVLPALIILTAFAVALNLKEETFSHNGGFLPTYLTLDENSEVTSGFTPSHRFVTAINLLLYADPGQTGEIEVTLLEGDSILWGSHLPVSQATNGSFCELPADLRLRRDTAYQLRICGRDLGGGTIAVGITDTGQYPLAELSGACKDNQSCDAQLICGFHYRHLARLRVLALAVELQLLFYWCVCLLCQKYCGKNRKVRLSGSTRTIAPPD